MYLTEIFYRARIEYKWASVPWLMVRRTNFVLVLHLLSFVHEHFEVNIWVIMISSDNKLDKF